MIDPLVESLISPTVATREFPRGSNGKYPHVSKVYRLMKQGWLESLKAPRLCTSREAVARCLLRMSAANDPAIPAPRSPAARSRANLEVERVLDRLGI